MCMILRWIKKNPNLSIKLARRLVITVHLANRFANLRTDVLHEKIKKHRVKFFSQSEWVRLLNAINHAMWEDQYRLSYSWSFDKCTYLLSYFCKKGALLYRFHRPEWLNRTETIRNDEEMICGDVWDHPRKKMSHIRNLRSNGTPEMLQETTRVHVYNCLWQFI